MGSIVLLFGCVGVGFFVGRRLGVGLGGGWLWVFGMFLRGFLVGQGGIWI